MKKTVLIVDDEAGIRQLTGMLIAGIGYETITCGNGEHAIPHIGSADMLITDFSMPGMNGVELAKIVKQQNPGMPVIIMTGTPWDLPTDHLADRVIEKPFRIDQLKKAISELLQ